jgi:hypothetical protein
MNTGKGGGMGSLLGSLYKAYAKSFKGNAEKGKKKVMDMLASVDLDPKAVKGYIAEIKKSLAGTIDESDRIAIEAFLKYAPLVVRLKVVNNLSPVERDELSGISEEIRLRVKYLQDYSDSLARHKGAKVKTVHDLSEVCVQEGIVADFGLIPAEAHVIGIEDEEAKVVKFFLEKGDYKKGPFIVAIPSKDLYK